MAKVVERHFKVELAKQFPTMKVAQEATKAKAPIYQVGEAVMAYQGSNGVRPMLYEAKVLKFDDRTATTPEVPFWYYMHYKGWAAKWDEWVPEDRVRKITHDAKKDLDALKDEMNVHFGGKAKLVIVDDPSFPVSDEDMKELIKLTEKAMIKHSLSVEEVATSTKLSAGVINNFLGKTLSKQASALQPRPSKCAAMVFNFLETLPEKPVKGRRTAKETKLAEAALEAAKTAPRRAGRAKREPAVTQSPSTEIVVDDRRTSGRVTKAPPLSASARAEKKKQEALENMQEMIELGATFPAKHFLHTLSTDLAEFSLLQSQCATAADTKALKKAEVAKDCKTAMRQLKSCLTIDASESGPAYSLGKGTTCEVCQVNSFNHLCLVCERCARACHIMCLPEPLAKVPEGDWMCHRCSNYRCPCAQCGGDGTETSAMLGVQDIPQGEKLGEFHLEGYCELSDGLTGPQVEKCVRKILEEYNKNMYTITVMGLHQDFTDVGFTTFKLRNAGRYDLMIQDFITDPAFSFLQSDAPWMPLVREILGDDCVHLHTGCMFSLPGSEQQKLHSDGDHARQDIHESPHCLNVFVPLVDLFQAIGATELVPRSHFVYNYDCRATPVLPCPKAGEVLLFDYRLKHRGMANNSDAPRPLLYLTYSKPSAKYVQQDARNFDKKRYRELPVVERHESQGKRQKRMVYEISIDQVMRGVDLQPEEPIEEPIAEPVIEEPVIEVKSEVKSGVKSEVVPMEEEKVNPLRLPQAVSPKPSVAPAPEAPLSPKVFVPGFGGGAVVETSN